MVSTKSIDYPIRSALLFRHTIPIFIVIIRHENAQFLTNVIDGIVRIAMNVLSSLEDQSIDQ